MQIPLEWLNEFVAVEDAVEVGTRLTMGGLEVEGIETERSEERPLVPVLDVYVTPNRGDCLSVSGVAREVAALYNRQLRLPAVPEAASASAQTLVSIQDPDLCPRYVARTVQSVTVGPSPQWLQYRLLSAGMRPINNVVDVTNYVMLEYGQPLHAFDLDLLEEERIVVRRAHPGETITTLDGVARKLTAEMLVIADAAKAIAVAGVMGGAETEVRSTTTRLLIEAAHFNPLSIRRTSRNLALRTEASYRFERVVDPDGPRRAANRACQLLAEIGAGEPVEEVVDVYPKRAEPRLLPFRPLRAATLLGMDITADVASDCLARLGFKVTPDPIKDVLLVEPPSFRPDVNIEEDLIEEVGRIYGYENIPETLPLGGATAGGDSAEGLLIARIKNVLVGCGLQEVVTHSLTAPSFFDTAADAARRVPIRNALSSEISGLRRSLLPTLLDVAQHNAVHGQNNLAIFEIGRVWELDETADGHQPCESISVAGLVVGPLAPGDWQQAGKSSIADYGLTRGILEKLFTALKIEGAEFMAPGGLNIAMSTEANTTAAPTPLLSDSPGPQFHPGRTAVLRMGPGLQVQGVVGEIHPRVASPLALRDRIYVFEIGLDALKAAMPAAEPRFRPLTRYPAVSRDLAPRIPVSTSYGDVKRAIERLAMPLIEDFRLTDVFTGAPVPAGAKSITLSFTFRSPSGTLTEAEVAGAMDRIRAALQSQCHAVFVA